jgi:hypothetical protein
LLELIEQVVAGELDKKRGAPIRRSAAQRLSGVQLLTGTGAGLGTIVGGGLFFTIEFGGFTGWGTASLWAAVASAQFNSDAPGAGAGDEIVSSGIVGVVAQPARKMSAPRKMIPAGLNTRSFC